MDWLKWIPTPGHSSRQAIDALRRKDAQRVRKEKRPVVESKTVGRPLRFSTWNGACICRPSVGAALACPVLLGLGDGSPKRDATPSMQLPSELLSACQVSAEAQLWPSSQMPSGQPAQQKYRGPIELLKEAYESTRSLGSTTVALAAMDNSTVIHGQIHPMVAVLSLGGCELVQLRRRDADKPSPSKAKVAAEHASPSTKACAEHTAERLESHRSSTDPRSPAAARLESHRSSSGQRSPESAEIFWDPDGTASSPTSPEIPSEAASPELPISPEGLQSGSDRGSLSLTPGESGSTAPGEWEIVFRAPPQKLLYASVGHAPVLRRDALDTHAEVSETLEAIEAQSSVQCATARQGDIVVLVSAGLLTDVATSAFVALCNETLPPPSEADFSPTPPASMHDLAQRIAKVSCVMENSPPSQVGQSRPGSVVVAEIVEWAPEDSACSSSPESTPEKAECQVTRQDSLARVMGRPEPILEGLEDMKTVHCELGLGDFAMSFHAEVPQIEVPKNPLRRTLTNDLICHLGG